MNKKIKKIIILGILVVLLLVFVVLFTRSHPIDDAAVNPENGDVAYVTLEAKGSGHRIEVFDKDGAPLFTKVLTLTSGAVPGVYFEGEYLCVHDGREDITYVYDRSGTRVEKRENVPDTQGKFDGWERSWSVYEVKVGGARYVYDTANIMETILGQKTVLFIENEQGERVVLYEKE